MVARDVPSLRGEYPDHRRALAKSSEVLVSQTVRDLMVGSDLAFEDRGLHTLRGVPGEWRVHAVARR
jgi:class 3 adenylate cyclase